MAPFGQRKNLPLLVLYGLASCLLVVITVSGLGQISRSYSDKSQRLIGLFESQTADQLAKGDVLAVSRALNRFISSEKIKCVYAKRFESEFFKWEPSPACTGIFAQVAVVDWSARGGITIKLVFVPSLTEVSTELIVLLLQLLCLCGIVVIIYRATNLNKAFELESVKLKNQIATVELEAKLQKETAIARTTQMLAHDVRKPFNLFRMTIDRVKSASSPEQISTILSESLPEVDRSLASVNGLISDVLNVGSENKIELTPVRLAPVVEEVVEELRKLYPSQTLHMKFDLPANLWIQADLTRLPRVFMNILSNAIEATGAKDVDMWISASPLESLSDMSTQGVEILLGNAGSFIAPESRERIFDLFFTAGKSGGTGLGLAIVKKIISQHGGTVVCSSEKSAAFPEGKVEFVFQLQAASPVEESLLQPSNTVQSRQGLPEAAQSSKGNMQSALKATPNIPGATQHAREATHAAPKPRVVFLDDSPLARWVWEAKLKPHTEIRCFEGPRELREAIESCGIELSGVHTIITDHYFAPDERLTGLDVARELRSGGFTGRILLASNGAFSPAELVGLVDKVVDKNPVEWEKLNTAETE